MSRMDQRPMMPIWALSVLLVLNIGTANGSEEDEVKQALVQFMRKLSPRDTERGPNWGWNMSSDPCADKWAGVSCDNKTETVRKIVLDEFGLTGSLDLESVCAAGSLVVLSLSKNNISGDLDEEIWKCTRLTHLYISENRFSGLLPESLSMLSNLKRLDISYNDFTGELPDLPRVSGLITFYAESNRLTGKIPDFDFTNLVQFNVSNNEFIGPVPDVHGRFSEASFLGNSGLCGELVSKPCPPPAPGAKKAKKWVLIYSGYIVLGIIIALFLVFKLANKKKSGFDSENLPGNDGSSKSADLKSGGNRSEYSMASVESGTSTSPPLVVLTSSVVEALRFEELLRAPAELLGRGKHGSLYKVRLDRGILLAVKRLKGWEIPNEEFKRRIERIGRIKHRNVLPPIAFYCSKQEKLLVYEYQHYGSLFQLLQGTKNGQSIDWGSRISIASTISEALAFMHEELREFQIPHGNLKSSNILLSKNMEPCLSEYGLMVSENQDPLIGGQNGGSYDTFKVDIYNFGVILLELLTGKSVQNKGLDLARWVQTMVREEWTVEVFDKTLISEGASEERMMKLLQVAFKCIDPSPSERPSIDRVFTMINIIKDEEERSLNSES